MVNSKAANNQTSPINGIYKTNSSESNTNENTELHLNSKRLKLDELQFSSSDAKISTLT